MPVRLILLALLAFPVGLYAEALEWKFEKSALSEKTIKSVSGPAATVAVDAMWSNEAALKFSGKQWLSVPEKTAREFKLDRFTMTARVRVDEPHAWGSLISFSQDNGNYERGWLLGYTNKNLSFKYSTGGRFHIVMGSSSLPLGDWIQVTVTHDGATIRLYQDGTQVASTAAAGKIVLPDIPTPFALGAYKDKDEFFGLKGAMRSVKLSSDVMSASEIKKKFGKPVIAFAVRPHVRFVSNDQAVVAWQGEVEGSAVVAYGKDKRKLDQFAKSTAAGKQHSLILKDLEPGQKYYYRIGMTLAGKKVMGRTHELDTSLNYLPPVVAASVGPGVDEGYLRAVLDAVKKQPSGYAFVLGLKDGDLAIALAKASQLNVMVFDKDADRINKFRKKAYAMGIYGRRVTAFHISSNELPVTACLANVILSERALANEKLPLTKSEAARLLRPNGGTLVLPDTATAKAWAGSIKKQGDVLGYRRPALTGSADWSHQYGNAANTTYTAEEMGGAQQASDLKLQWLGRPGADFNIDRQPRVSAPLAVNGRLFHQGMNRIIALDAYNGAVLWSMEVPDFRRLNVPHDSSNWCADAEHLYMVVEENAWVVDAATGKVLEYLQIPSKMRESHQWGYIANEGDLLIGTSVRSGSHYKEFWGSVHWFDKVGSAGATTQVCSDKIFGYNKTDWKGLWAYGEGVIINSSISLRDGKLYFLENRDPKWKGQTTGRIVDKALWLNLHVVCLDAKTGKKKWDEKLPPFKHMDGKNGFIQSAYGLVSDHGYLTVFSESVLTEGKFKGGGQFVYHLFDQSNGKRKWSQETAWRHNHHGAHISHPIMLEDIVFTDPYSVNLKTGKVLPDRLAHRQKCPTPVAWKNGLMFRGTAPESGSITLVMWNEKDKQLTGWNRLRPNCWLNSLPTQGGLIMPEGGGGCSCGGWMETSVGFLPLNVIKGEEK